MPKNWTGVAPGEDVQLEVSPIGSSSLGQQERVTLDRNISLMLQASLTGGSIELAEGDITHAGERMQALLFAFCRLLAKARRRQVIRKYTPARMATRCSRGRTVFPAQVFESIRRPGYFVSKWVALDEDTPENRFIKIVLARFRPRVSGPLRYKVDEQLCDFDNVSLVSSPDSEWRRIRFDRPPREYKELLRLGKSLLDGRVPASFRACQIPLRKLSSPRAFMRHLLHPRSPGSPKRAAIGRRPSPEAGSWGDGIAGRIPAGRLLS